MASKSTSGSKGSVVIQGREYDIATTTELDLMRREITNEELKQIGKLTNLTKLELSFTKISDITPLAGLKNLTYVWLLRTQVTDADMAWIKEQLPNCDVALDH